ncbi:putative ABC transport system permease protein [Salinibacillus kushneri]|uniref:Putative ABC transport system permease protein n=1 Tax=Salinibacillus kushneri TaxID=237682 RepID=A0A1I0DVQ2_9BACI|nr:FtsX-like permease family protein [Salinibacillus kushneri]SET36594.1 putative ABC transport system permease protein [Salinibacillus kushneri]
MNIINKLTIRHLKENKKRTLVTVFGVIISVAMIMAVATLAVSFLDLMKRQVMAQNGEWHVLYENVNEDQLDAIENDDDTKEVIISRDRGYALFESQNEYKPYLFVKEYNKKGFDHFPIELSDGRLPQAENEVVISEHIETNGGVDYEIGEQLTLDVGQRFLAKGSQEQTFGQSDALQTEEDEVTETIQNQETETYTIVGEIERPTWEPTWAPGYTVISYLDEGTISANATVNASVILNNVNHSIFDDAKEFAAEHNIDSVSFHNELLRYYGVTDDSGLRTMLFSLSGIIIALIVIGSVALIYNAFGISVSERARHLGMLSSVGATKKQKRNSVLFEGLVVGTISIPIGIVAGLVGIGVTFTFINSLIEGALGIEQGLHLTVTPISVLIACSVSLITILISSYLPARKASRISAIDAIRQTQDVKLSGKKVKTSKLVRKLFGIEAEIGLKNLKRNKKRYQVTVFSLVISIVLFLSVTYFTDNLKKLIEITQSGINYDISVSTSQGSEENNKLMKSFAKLPNVKDSAIIKQVYLSTWIDEKRIADSLQDTAKENPDMLKNDKFNYKVKVVGLDQNSLEDYAEKIGVNAEELQDSENPSAIVINKINYRDPTKNKFVETKSIDAEVGQKLELIYAGDQSGKRTVEIGALTGELPMGVDTGGLGNLTIIVSGNEMEKVIPDNFTGQPRTNLYLTSSDPMATQKQMEELNTTNMHIYNVYQSRQQEEQMTLLISVFTYGFIALITAISVANIFNTISTSVALRTREFAMLKSIGMTPKGFNKMINYESIFYGVKALLYGIPISIAVMYLIYRSLMNTFSYGFTLPWLDILFVIIAIFIIVGVTMLYSSAKVKKQNIIDALKQENI